MEAITLFDHEQFGEIRITDRRGEPWFIAKDIAAALGYADTRQAIRKNCKKPKTVKINSASGRRGNPNMVIISEADLYRLVLRSRLPEADRFMDWVAEEVLPSIRKTGMYHLPGRDLEMLALRRKCAIDFLQKAKELGIVGEGYVKRYMEHSLAVVGGTEPEGERIIDISSFLEGRGVEPTEVRRRASSFGKKVKAAYVDRNGEPPEKGIRFINGADRSVFCYTENDLPIFEAVFDEMFEETEDLNEN